jgi:hypothetical protein
MDFVKPGTHIVESTGTLRKTLFDVGGNHDELANEAQRKFKADLNGLSPSSA